MASNFSLRDALLAGGVPELGTHEEQIEYIHIDRLLDDGRNFYELSDLDGLAANIELIGLQQPLRVRLVPEQPECYTIVSGHRRRAAIRKLVEEGREDLQKIPCIVERRQVSEAFQELMLIYANSDTRKMSNADLSKQVEHIKFLLYQLKEEGVEFPGRMRDHVAEACQISKSKLARLEVIRKGLIPELYAKFESDELVESAAYTMAHFPEDFQQRMLKAFKKMPSTWGLEQLFERSKDGWKWEPTLICPDGKPCGHGDAFLRHDAECGAYSACGGNKCCITCEANTRNYSPCSQACSKAKAARKDIAEDRKAKEEKARQKGQSKLKKAMQADAIRLMKAVDAAGLDDKEKIGLGYGRYWTVKAIRNAANGEFGDKYFYCNEYAPEELGNPIGLAKQLNCSTDYLLGLTDDLTPAVCCDTAAGSACGRWRNAHEKWPEEGQLVLVMHNCEDEGVELEYELDAAVYKDGQFVEFNCEYFHFDDVEKWSPLTGPLDQPKPRDEWEVWADASVESPVVSGLYLCLTGPMNGGGKLFWWNADERQWEHPGAKCRLNADIKAWVPCPAIPESLSWNREVVDE